WLKCSITSRHPSHALKSPRLASLANTEPDRRSAAEESVADAGLFRASESGQLVCYCCGQQATAGAIQQHPATGLQCSYYRLVSLLSQTGSLTQADQSEKSRAVQTLQTLRSSIEQPISGIVESFGYPRRLVDYTVAHSHLLDLPAPRRPGDLIEKVLACQDALETTSSMGLLSAVDIRSVLQEMPLPTTAQNTEFQVNHPAALVVPSAAAPPTTVGNFSEGLAESSSDRCMVCQTSVRDRVILPCTHFSACHRCLSTASRCPACQGSILATLTAFIC
ncbi:hypothetical protein BOX15_Mlig002869g2, partial [Macrostomum lignano]